ncbi:DUF2617 family protein [Gordonia sp. (in: high G+C Gram-positive bacteria)]|uniref:DUF2617 family protein n=1 Tax=Gordonia sp. (in: high G+C Gram-positive bacteria) TaxID=84139 RepID=UPI0039E23AEA
MTQAPHRAAALTLSLDVGEQPALTHRRARLGGFDVDLRLLGSSHQVVVTGRHEPLRETLADLPGEDPFLPTRWCRDGYTFRADVAAHETSALRILVRLLGEQVGAPDSVGVLCTHDEPLAVTAVRAAFDAADDVLRWETWHTYPAAGEVVYTASSVSRR